MALVRWTVRIALAGCGFSTTIASNDPDSGGGDGDSRGDGVVARDVPHIPASVETIGGLDVTLPNGTVIDTGAGTITPSVAGAQIEIVAQEPSGDGLALIRARSITIASGATVRVVGSNQTPRPLVLFADRITIAGTLDGGAKRAVPGPGGRASGGPGLGADGEHRDTFHDSGGGGGAYAVAASAGGDAGTTCGTQANGGNGGAVFGLASLDVLAGGAAGGAGASLVCTLGAPGAGGGAIQLSALTRLEITGAVTVGGGGGGGGINCGGSDTGGGSGGGSGGALYLDAPAIVLSGIVAAHGGGGGGGASSPGSNGGFGGDAAASLAQATGGISGGSYGTVGGKGATGALASTAGGNQGCDGNGAGGGGSVGRIVIHAPGAVTGGGMQSPTAMLVTTGF